MGIWAIPLWAPWLETNCDHLAGVETTQHTFKWLVLLMTYYPHIQHCLRQEIQREIGERVPEYEDKHRCHYVMAFISETLRFRNVNPLAIYHKTSVDLNIGLLI